MEGLLKEQELPDFIPMYIGTPPDSYRDCAVSRYAAGRSQLLCSEMEEMNMLGNAYIRWLLVSPI